MPSACRGRRLRQAPLLNAGMNSVPSLAPCLLPVAMAAGAIRAVVVTRLPEEEGLDGRGGGPGAPQSSGVQRRRMTRADGERNDVQGVDGISNTVHPWGPDVR